MSSGTIAANILACRAHAVRGMRSRGSLLRIASRKCCVISADNLSSDNSYYVTLSRSPASVLYLPLRVCLTCHSLAAFTLRLLLQVACYEHVGGGTLSLLYLSWAS